MLITADKIAAFNPCKNRFDNFKQQYPGFEGNIQEFLSLDNITYSDKIWVCVRLMTRNQKFYFARACAASVLEIFEARYPNDLRVRDLIKYMNTIDDVTKITPEQIVELKCLRNAAYAYADAAYTADAANADYAAYTAYTAYTAAYAAAYTAYTAAYADAAAAAAADAAADAYAAADARETQQQINLIILNDIMVLNI